MKREVYVMVVNRPDGVTVELMKRYIKEAVESWSGQFPKESLLFGWFRKRGNGVLVQRRNLSREFQAHVEADRIVQRMLTGG